MILLCSILVANNGLAAVKFISYVRRWASETFGNDRTITFVAMATPEDLRVNAEHIRLADQFMEVCFCAIIPVLCISTRTTSAPMHELC